MRYSCLFLLCFLLMACSGNNDEMEANEEHAQLATNVSIFSSKENQKEWLLLADTVNFADLQSATLNNPFLNLKQNGEDSARITGKVGSFDYTKHLVSIEGNARIESLAENLVISANCFLYNIDTDQIWSNGKTIVTRGNASITAKNGIVTDSQLNTIEFKKQSTRLPDSIQDFKQK